MQDDETGRGDGSGMGGDGPGIGADSPGISGDGPGIGADRAWAGPGAAYGERPRRRKRGRVAVYAGVAVLAAGLGAAATVGLNSGEAAPPPAFPRTRCPAPGTTSAPPAGAR